jgi:HK97 family phage prohead protease
MSGQLEYLTCGFAGELKFAADSEASRKFSGHGAVFKNVDAYGDVIDPGAFAQWLADVKGGKQQWPAMLSQHGGWGMTAEDMTPVGIYTDLAEDGTGLAFEGELADTQRAIDLYKLMKMKPRPAINGMSIGYIARKFTAGAKAGEPRRRLHQIDVMEISIVTFPANTKARAQAKSIDALANVREIEEFLCAGGLSKSQAVALISKMKSFGLGDPAGGNGGPGDPEAEVVLRQSPRHCRKHRAPPRALPNFPERKPLMKSMHVKYLLGIALVIAGLCAFAGHPIVPVGSARAAPLIGFMGDISLVDIKRLIDEQGSAWTEYKKTNDTLIAAKADGKVVTELEQKLAKLDEVDHHGEKDPRGRPAQDAARGHRRWAEEPRRSPNGGQVLQPDAPRQRPRGRRGAGPGRSRLQGLRRCVLGAGAQGRQAAR